MAQSQAIWGWLYKSTLFMSLQLGSSQFDIIHGLFSVLAITCCILHGKIGLIVMCHDGIMQMGSNMKKSIFDEQTSKALKKWHMAVKKKQVTKGDTTRTLGNGSPRSSVGSPLHLTGPTLHRFKTMGHSTRFSGYDDLEASDLESDPTTPIIRAEEHSTTHVTDDDSELQVHVPQNGESSGNEDDFSFAKPAPKR